MIINSYQIDGKKYSLFPQNQKCNNFSVDLEFICLSNSIVKKNELKIDKRKINVLVFGIGNYTYKNDSALIDLGKKSKVLI